MPRKIDNFDETRWEVGPSRSYSLMDLCGEAFSVIFTIHAGGDPGHPDDLRNSIAGIFRDFEANALRYSHGEEDVKACRYALCALIDETILNSQWAFRDQWGTQPLQLDYFGDNMAGERFFDLLERVRKKGRRKTDLLEVFCACLILGFKGKYKLQGKDRLEKLMYAVMEEANSPHGRLSRLATHWQIPEEAVEAQKQTLPRWAWITGLSMIGACLLFYAIFYLWLGSLAEDAAGRMIL